MSKIYFEGTCDVCGEKISMDYDSSYGIIDTKIEPDGRVSTWIRHYATAPKGANPDCAYYSSVVTEVKLTGCPFCGEQPVIEKDGEFEDVACLNIFCLVQPRALGTAEIPARKTWNTRR